MLDGRRVTTREQWFNDRRPELKRLFQHYMYGFLPPAPRDVTSNLKREDRGALGGKATLKEVTVAFGPPEAPPLHLMLIVPNRRPGAAPVVLGMNYFGNHTLVRDPAVHLSTSWMPERGQGVVNNRSTEASRGTWADIWRIEYLIERGYALATFYNGDIDPDRPDERGIQRHFRQPDSRDDCGTIAAWAWGLSRAVDYLVTDVDVDKRRVVVTGHSRLGKAALLAAALDERIAMAIPHQAGCGGSAPSRSTIQPPTPADPATRRAPGRPAETVKQINEAFPHWFNARFKEFNDRPDLLPFDQHCLVALCAPRPVLFTNGRDDTWINPGGQFEALRAAAPVYRFLGVEDFATQLPPDGQLVASTLGYFLRPGGHSLKPEDWKAFLDFADKHLGQPDRPRTEASRIQPGAVGAGEAAEAVGQIIEVPRWEIHEFELHGPCRVDNPFRDAALVGEFISSSGRTNLIPGFFDGADTWRLRFAPDEEGEWRYRLRGEGVGVFQTGRLRCTAAHGHGFVRVHPQNPYAFAHADGTPFFPMGDTCYGLYDDSPVTSALRREYLDARRRQRFNFVRMSIGHSEFRAEADPACWAWGGTPAKPDLDRLNPEFFRGLDNVFRDLRRREINVELILFNFYRRPFTDTRLWTPARERLWLRYVVARYAAFDNLFLWTLANEYETHPDGAYRLDNPADVNWVKATAHQVKELDPYHHLVTVHPVISSSTRGVSPGDPFDPPWRIGGFFGEGDALDVLSQQTGQRGAGVTWDERLECWVGDDPDLVASLRADRRFGKPVLNTENGYEYLRGQPTQKGQVHHTDKVRRSAWRVVCAGGYFAAGFNGTIGHNDIWNRIDAPNDYSFVVQDEGAARQLGALYDFFTALPFWRLQPFQGVAGDLAVGLAEPGEIYMVYLPRGGKLSLDLTTATSALLTARWFNPREARFGEPWSIVGGHHMDFSAPDDHDWTLLLRR
jgi:dienelactone hydrolase